MDILKTAGAIAATGALAFTLAGCSSDATTETTAEETAATETAAAEAATAETAPAEDYTVADETLDTSNPYAAYITGTLTNNKDTDVSYVQVEYVVYDADGAQIGTALANTNNLKAGGSWKYEAYVTADAASVASFELAEITGF